MSDCEHKAVLTGGGKSVCMDCRRRVVERGDKWVDYYSPKDVETLRAHNERLENEIERKDDALNRIYQWSQAYPVDVFIPPTPEEMKRANEILEQNGISFTAINGHVMRHVISGVEDIARTALQQSREDVKE